MPCLSFLLHFIQSYKFCLLQQSLLSTFLTSPRTFSLSGSCTILDKIFSVQESPKVTDDCMLVSRIKVKHDMITLIENVFYFEKEGSCVSYYYDYGNK